MLAGELHNSSASSIEYRKPIWDKLSAMHLNTVIDTVSWELLEPEEPVRLIAGGCATERSAPGTCVGVDVGRHVEERQRSLAPNPFSDSQRYTPAEPCLKLMQ